MMSDPAIMPPGTESGYRERIWLRLCQTSTLEIQSVTDVLTAPPNAERRTPDVTRIFELDRAGNWRHDLRSDSPYFVAMREGVISTPWAGSGTAPLTLTPLTGRDTELSLLKDRWEQTQEGMGQVVLVVGRPGLGKSRLVQTLTERMQARVRNASSAEAGESTCASVDQDSPVIEWRCAQRFQNSELHPVSDYLERFLWAGCEPSPAARFDRLAQHLEKYDLCRPESVALFAKLLFLPPDERYAVASLSAAREREATFCVLRDWFRLFRSTVGAPCSRGPALD